jgi:hypothetical protein
MMKLIANISIFLFAFVSIVFSSCKKQLPDIGGTSAQKVANEWWVTLDQGTTKDVYKIGHFKIATYNTADNNNQIWIDDFENGWQVKFKSLVDYSSLTFTSDPAAKNEYYAITVKQTDGKILLNAGHSKSGNVTDSIHMKVEFSDDPGTIYEMNGTARTRFIEDEY